ncbi:MAG: hypothetical protein ACFE95_12340 [Candidatus Hodarchaeota archaeon]
MAAVNFIYCYDCNIMLKLGKYSFHNFPKNYPDEISNCLQFIQDNIIEFLFDHKGHRIWLGDDGEDEWLNIINLQKMERLKNNVPYFIEKRLNSAIKKYNKAKTENSIEWIGYHQGIQDICREIIGIIEGRKYKGEE